MIVLKFAPTGIKKYHHSLEDLEYEIKYMNQVFGSNYCIEDLEYYEEK